MILSYSPLLKVWRGNDCKHLVRVRPEELILVIVFVRLDEELSFVEIETKSDTNQSTSIRKNRCQQNR